MGKSKKSAIANTEKSLQIHPSLDLSRTVMEEFFISESRPWIALDKLSAHICERGIELPYDHFDEISENVWVHQSVYLSPYAKLTPPVIICGGAKICHYCHVECSVIGSFSQVSEFSTVKNSIVFDKAKICGHNSVNSSILGYESVIGEGAKLPDRRIDGTNVSFKTPDGICISEKTKLGSVICDGAIVGALCVINPGTIIDLNAKIRPHTSISGYAAPYTSK